VIAEGQIISIIDRSVQNNLIDEKVCGNLFQPYRRTKQSPSSTQTQKRIYLMSLSFKILPAIALAIALSPMAAQAHGADPAQKTACGFAITPSSATIDNPSTVYGGVNANSFPDSFGG
jgi:hypothetical protein